ncbi:MAG: hypothetical protein AAF587_30750 [Bacteroidota bacterium]
MTHIAYKGWLIAVFSMCSFLFAQEDTSLVHLFEESTTGKYKGQVQSSGIVDLNSMIRIRLDRTEIEEKLFEMAGISRSSDRLGKLKQMNRLLAYETDIVRMLRELRSGKPISLDTYGLWAELENDLFAALEEIDKPLSDEINQRAFAGEDADKGFGTLSEFIIYVVQGKADTLRNELTEEFGFNQENGDSSLLVYFRLGAFLKNREGGRPIHVENFDSYDPGRFSEIKRFGTPIGPEEKKELQTTVNLAQQLQSENQEMVKGFGQQLKGKVDDLFLSKKAVEQLLATSKRIKASLKKEEGSGGSSSSKSAKERLKSMLDLSEVSLDQVANVYGKIANIFNQPFNPGSFGSIPPNITADLSMAFHNARNQFETLSSTTEKEGMSSLRLAQLDTLKTQFVELGSAVNHDATKLQELFSEIDGMFQIFKKSYLKSEKFTDKVKRFRPGNIPSEGFIELRYISERRAGDQVLIKATLERGTDPKNPNFERKEVFRQYLSLTRISPHVKMGASIILANPYNRASNPAIALQNTYQFAPSYGVFMKWGSRKSRFFNDFVNVGIGMSFTSPDFNLDGTPEFGAGAVVTALRDWVSAGWGWNFGADAPYSFIGFNIPFTVAGFSNPNGNRGGDDF